MNALIVFASLVAIACASPSGIHGGGAVVAGPAGVVTSHGAIGPVGHGIGLGLGGLGVGGLGVGLGGLGLGHGAVIAAPAVASTVVAGPALGVGLGHGLGLGGIGVGGLGLGVAHGAGVITNGGGTIGVSGHGAAIRGPGTAPVVVAGPSGKIAADGLWGPTANVGLGAHGHGW